MLRLPCSFTFLSRPSQPIKRGDTQEFDLSAIRDAARRMGDDSELGDLRGAGGGTMFIKDGASAPVAIGSEDVSYGTMIVKDRQQPAPLDAPSDTGIPGGGGGTVIFRPAAGDGGGGGTMVFNNSAASAPVPGFMRQFQSSNNVGGGGASSRGGAVGSNNGFGAAAGGVDKEDLGSEASNKARHKYDFTHLNVKEIDEVSFAKSLWFLPLRSLHGIRIYLIPFPTYSPRADTHLCYGAGVSRFGCQS